LPLIALIFLNFLCWICLLICGPDDALEALARSGGHQHRGSVQRNPRLATAAPSCA
jgi:hypothetical protein